VATTNQWEVAEWATTSQWAAAAEWVMTSQWEEWVMIRAWEAAATVMVMVAVVQWEWTTVMMMTTTTMTTAKKCHTLPTFRTHQALPTSTRHPTCLTHPIPRISTMHQPRAGNTLQWQLPKRLPKRHLTWHPIRLLCSNRRTTTNQHRCTSLTTHLMRLQSTLLPTPRTSLPTRQHLLDRQSLQAHPTLPLPPT